MRNTGNEMEEIAPKMIETARGYGRGYCIFSIKKRATNFTQKQGNNLKEESLNPKGMTKIYAEGKINAKWNDQRLTKALANLAKKSDLLPSNRALIERFVNAARIGRTILKGQKRKVGDKRCVKFIQDLQKLDRYFQKPLGEVTQPDMERFVLDLEEGRLKTSMGKPYSLETQAVIKKLLRKFYKWLLGENKFYPPVVEWIDTSTQVPEYRSISKPQLDTLLAKMTSNTSDNLLRNRALLCVMFDSGCRAEELLNIRLKHLTLENGSYKVRVEFSKTLKRTLSLPLSTECLHRWLEVHPARQEQLAQLFPMTYDGLRLIVGRLGKEIGVKITPHSMRHAAASYWARHLSQYQLCYRMGWSMNSKQPARYIDREGLDQEKTLEVVEVNKVASLSRENAHLNQRLAMLEEQMNRLLADDKEELLAIVAKVKAMRATQEE